jgi:hypothetical protein
LGAQKGHKTNFYKLIFDHFNLLLKFRPKLIRNIGPRLTESFDVIGKLFYLITKLKENMTDEAFQGDEKVHSSRSNLSFLKRRSWALFLISPLGAKCASWGDNGPQG